MRKAVFVKSVRIRKLSSVKSDGIRKLSSVKSDGIRKLLPLPNVHSNKKRKGNDGQFHRCLCDILMRIGRVPRRAYLTTLMVLPLRIFTMFRPGASVLTRVPPMV